MISVGFSRNDSGQPVMREIAQPTSEQRYYIEVPFEDCWPYCFHDGDMSAEKVYSHSSADVS